MEYIVTLKSKYMDPERRSHILDEVADAVSRLGNASINARGPVTLRVACENITLADLEAAVEEYGVVDLPARYETLDSVAKPASSFMRKFTRD